MPFPDNEKLSYKLKCPSISGYFFIWNSMTSSTQRKKLQTFLLPLQSTSFPGSLIFPPPGAREERPWFGLVTCLQSKKIPQGRVVCLLDFCGNNGVDRPARLSCACLGLNNSFALTGYVFMRTPISL